MKKKKAAKISDLKKGVEKIDKSQLAVKEKEFKPTTVAALKTLRFTFYAFLLLVIAIGLFQIVKSKQPKIVENIIRYEISESESDKAKAFAESFVKEYLTYGNTVKDNAYRTILTNYLNSSVVVGRPEYANGSSEVIDTMTYSLEKIDEANSDIVVKASIKLTNNNKMVEKYDEKTGERISIPTVEFKEVYVSVPIKAEGGKVVVNDYPTFLKVSDKLETDMETYYGSSTATDSEKQVIKKVLEDFFGVYYSGTAGQIKTFFKEDPKLDGLQNAFKFNAIKNIEAYLDGPVYTAIVIVEITDNDLGAVFNQRHLITLEKKGDRYVIISMKNRGK